MLRFNSNPVRRSEEVGVVAGELVIGCEVVRKDEGCVVDGHKLTGWKGGERTGEGDESTSVVSESTSAK